jgi:uncharacterized membrane protein
LPAVQIEGELGPRHIDPAGALRDVGIDDNFMKSVGETLRPDPAALCVLIRQMTADKVLEEIQKFGGS